MDSCTGQEFGRIRSTTRLSYSGKNPKQRACRQERLSEDLKYPQWQMPLREAILEFDAERLSNKVQAAEKAIDTRLRGLTAENHDFQERQALKDALATLEILRRQTRRWLRNSGAARE
jgi:hypothetical protein